MPEINSVGIHCNDVFLIITHFQLSGNNPLFTFHYEHLYTWDMSEYTCRILRANTKHILCQLLCDSRCSTGIVMQNSIFRCRKHTLKVDSEMMIKTFIFSINKSFEKFRIYFFIFYRCTILIKEFTYKLSVCRIYFRGLGRVWVQNLNETRRFTE